MTPNKRQSLYDTTVSNQASWFLRKKGTISLPLQNWQIITSQSRDAKYRGNSEFLSDPKLKDNLITNTLQRPESSRFDDRSLCSGFSERALEIKIGLKLDQNRIEINQKGAKMNQHFSFIWLLSFYCWASLANEFHPGVLLNIAHEMVLAESFQICFVYPWRISSSV